MPRLSGQMAAMMYQAGRQKLNEDKLLVPVPLHSFRLWRRSFNQSALLARELGKLSGLDFSMDALVRKQSTRHQVGLSRRERIENVQGAFEVSPDAQFTLAGRSIVLIDDVLTTGATLDACNLALKAAGAKRVDTLVFAAVEPDEVAEERNEWAVRITT
ncbi:ComF family protein [Flexibacterium corallicola]|uniref:ComF family protein n=1 Tax=Flexibacterium corallicola TaxID=3037259 RepID=UPI00286F83E2|nr:ComF family protein [Pseudovibrio sp. M1P-2-3]